MQIAITRGVSPAFDRCELTHLERRPIDLDLAREQHRAYETCLARLDVDVRRLRPEPAFPDSVFVEDAAVVLDEIAVVTRPGAEPRRGESASVESALRPFRRLARIHGPATLDGGDVLQAGRTLFVGRSRRSNAAAVDQLSGLLSPLGYEVKSVPLDGCLHLKSAVTRVSAETLLVNPDWVDPAAFDGRDVILVDPSEPAGANALLAGETVVYPEACPRTRERLERRHLEVVAIDVSELAKAEGGVTCCSLLFEVEPSPGELAPLGDRS